MAEFQAEMQAKPRPPRRASTRRNAEIDQSSAAGAAELGRRIDGRAKLDLDRLHLWWPFAPHCGGKAFRRFDRTPKIGAACGPQPAWMTST
jgi:hypothetical protein